MLLDASGPVIALESPSVDESGICSVLEGVIRVVGSVSDPQLSSFTLEAAPGKDAATGFVLISSGTSSVASGVLGNWDTSPFSSHHQTLSRL